MTSAHRDDAHSPNELAEKLGRAFNLAGVESGQPPVLSRLTGGASRESWLVHCGVADAPSFVLRLGLGVDSEAELLTLAAAAGVPVPEVVLAATDNEALGQPFLLTRFIPGESLPTRILRNNSLIRARKLLTAQLGDALARIHSIAPNRLRVDLPADPPDILASYRRDLDRTGRSHPVFEIALQWLAQERPSPLGQVLLHGDFRLGNLMVDGYGLAAVLDWELGHLGDPRVDLGWLCSPFWRFGGIEPVAGLGSYTELLNSYRKAGGADINPAELNWFEVLATLRWGILCIGQSQRYVAAAGPALEMAALGRRVCEIEWQLLEMVAS